MAESPFEITTSGKAKKGSLKGVIIALVVVLFLGLGIFGGVLLVRQNQLVDCTDNGGGIDPELSNCNQAGRTAPCGGEMYICPEAGGNWERSDGAGGSNATNGVCNIAGPTGLTTENLTGTSVKLKWTPGVGSQIRLWVSTNAEPTGTCSLGSTSSACIVSDEHLSPTTTEYQLTNLTPNTRYYWRLMSWTSEGCDAGTSVLNFTTTTTSGSATATATATATASATSTATATGQATAAPTPTKTSTSKSTSTPKATQKAAATKAPIPETGTGWPTYLVGILGALVIIGSLLLAL